MDKEWTVLFTPLMIIIVKGAGSNNSVAKRCTVFPTFACKVNVFPFQYPLTEVGLRILVSVL